jgi:hypothetical protein
MRSIVDAIDRRLKLHFGFDTSLLAFLIKQRTSQFAVPDVPHFDSDETTLWFSERLRESGKYLEFGTGGSTYLAALLGIPFVAVDSDPYFLRSVQEKIRRAGLLRVQSQTFWLADIGLTGPWGYPVRPWRASEPQLKKFRRYSEPPPACYEGSLPDFVLIDGRFRVACALKALRMLRNQENWTIAVDDYADRPEYSIIEKFARLERRVGRMAVFSGAKPCSLAELESGIGDWELVPD